MNLPADLRAALCLVGQCASPIQAAWIGSHLLDGVQGTTGTPLLMNTMYKMWLLRQAHGMCPKKADRPLQIRDETEGVPFEVNLKHSTKVGELLAAEERLHGQGHRRALQDLYGQLPETYDITLGAISGSLTLQQSAKKQRKIYDQQSLRVIVQGSEGTTLFDAHVPSGTPVFEVLHSIPNMPQVYYKEIMDEEGNSWRLDERIRHQVKFIHYRFASDLFGAGHFTTIARGLGNECIDKEARRMIAEVGAFRTCTWIPAAQLTWMIQDPNDVMVNHWLVAALHGVLRGCAVIQHHWLLLELVAKGNLLSVTCWDGLDHRHRHQVRQFAEAARQKLVLRTLVVTFNAEFSQEAADTCGTIAILHLGLILDYWKDKEMPSEMQLHQVLLANNEGVLVAGGRDDEEEQLMIFQLQEILSRHGVPAEKTDERAHMAMKKIGMKPIAAALKAKNQ